MKLHNYHNYIILLFIVTGCSSPPKPPEPQGEKVLINARVDKHLIQEIGLYELNDNSQNQKSYKINEFEFDRVKDSRIMK